MAEIVIVPSAAAAGELVAEEAPFGVQYLLARWG